MAITAPSGRQSIDKRTSRSCRSPARRVPDLIFGVAQPLDGRLPACDTDKSPAIASPNDAVADRGTDRESILRATDAAQSSPNATPVLRRVGKALKNIAPGVVPRRAA
jgi:hypothetical protein